MRSLRRSTLEVVNFSSSCQWSGLIWVSTTVTSLSPGAAALKPSQMNTVTDARRKYTHACEHFLRLTAVRRRQFCFPQCVRDRGGHETAEGADGPDIAEGWWRAGMWRRGL